MKEKQPSLPINSPLIKVGDVKRYAVSKDKKTGSLTKKKIPYGYEDFEYDIDGWADSAKYLPYDFDLIYMRLEREKTIPGWIRGSTWCGLRLKSSDKVVSWKRRLEEGDFYT